MLPEALAWLILCALPMVTVLVVLGASAALRRFWPRLPTPWLVVAAHTALIAAAMAFCRVGKLYPPLPFDDVYVPFYVVPGIHIYLFTGRLARWVDPLLFLDRVPPHAAAVLAIVVAPGLVGIALGGALWYAVARTETFQAWTRRFL